ncbi:response regulator [Desulfolithobacter sp.]
MAYHILIIDDEPQFCISLKMLLEADGYAVDVAHSGQEALFFLEKKTFHATLLDIGLPDISGNEIAAHISRNHPNTAIVILTGIATVENAVEAMRQGVYDYLRKPCDPEQLLRIISRAIEHKKLQSDLRASERRFRQLSEATWEGIFIYEEGCLLLANQQLCEMFGYSEQELIGEQIFNILLDRNSIRAMPLQKTEDALGPFEAKGIKKDGTRFPVEIRVKHIDYQGKTVQVAAIRDISARREAEQKRLVLMEKLADAKRMESLGLMAGSVAHDLNNILAGILTYPELLLLDLDEDFKYREEIELIRDAGKRAAAVVNDLLTVARGATCKKEVHNLNVIISGYVNSPECKELTKRYPDITIETELEQNLCNTRCSPVHISKSIMNLVTNAVEAQDDNGKGTVRIRTCNMQVTKPIRGYETIEPGRYVVVTVEDNGPGIKNDDIEHIFQPFYSKKVMGRSGTGLGLAVVWNTVHDHGGYVDLISTKKGTCFALYFPATKEQFATPIKELPLQVCTGSGERILVVDDQKSQREIARRLLTRLGYKPYVVSSGEEAVEFIKRESVDLVMLDMIMGPGLNGCETYQRIVQHAPGLRAIITSGYSSPEDIEKARHLGISQFIKKPYSMHDLGQALKLEIAQ